MRMGFAHHFQSGFIVSPSTIDKIFEIYTFFENRTKIYTFFENGLEIYICRTFCQWLMNSI